MKLTSIRTAAAGLAAIPSRIGLRVWRLHRAPASAAYFVHDGIVVRVEAGQAIRFAA